MSYLQVVYSRRSFIRYIILSAVFALFVLSFSLFFNSRQVLGTSTTSVSATFPSTSSPWSGTVNITMTIVKNDTLWNTCDILIDGVLDRHWQCSNPYIYPLNTTKLYNGQHQLFVHGWGEGGGYPEYGTAGPYIFTTSNNKTLVELRANYRDLYLTPNQVQPLSAKLMYSDKSSQATTATYSSANTAVATVDASGNVTAKATGVTTITASASGVSTTVTIIVDNQNITPHFGKDGSLLTAYDPAKSFFVTSMFFMDGGTITREPTMPGDLRAANINAFESGFYIPPANGQTFEQWKSAEDSTVIKSITDALNATGMNVLLTGDDIARGSAAVYNSIKGPGSTWSPTSVEYAFTAAKNLGKAIGVEMVDEISFSFSNPYPEGRLGQPNGPTSLSCSNDVCSVNWPNAPLNGAWQFLITGATSNTAINRLPPNYYSINSNSNGVLTFNSSGVGTKTFTAATDPGLIFQMLASNAGLPNNDYLTNDSFAQLMSIINRVSGRTKNTWPVAGDAWPSVFQNWESDPRFSDYGTMYWSMQTRAQPSIWEQLNSYTATIIPKLAVTQRTKPLLMETTASGPMYRINGVPTTITSFNGNTITFAAPHNIDPATVTWDLQFSHQSPRVTVTGNSNSALNGNYYVYQVVDSTTVKVFSANNSAPNPNWDQTSGIAVTFADGTKCPLYAISPTLSGGVMDLQSGGNITLDNSQGSSGSLPSNIVGCGNYHITTPQLVTVSGSSNAAINRKWLALQLTTLGINVEDYPVGTGTGGSGAVITDNYYLPGRNDLQIVGNSPQMAAASLAYAAEHGFAGARMYNFGSDINKNYQFNRLFNGEPTSGDGIQPGTNPRYNGPTSTAMWQAISNTSNLIKNIESFLLQPKLNSPDYGSLMVTTARTSTYGKLLMLTNNSEAPVTEVVDLSEYNPGGGTGTIYRANNTSLTSGSVSGLSQSVTFQPGETVAFTFAGNGSGDTAAPSVPSGLSAAAISSSQVNLSWTASTDNVGIIGYKIYRDGNQIATPTTTTYSDTGLTSATTYSYTVSAYDAAGNNSGQSASVSVTTPSSTPPSDTTPPSIPSGLTATAISSSQVNLSWTASTDNVGVTGYKIYRDSNQITTSTTTTYSNTGLSPATTYSYTVSAYDAAGNNSAQSSSVSVTTPSSSSLPFTIGSRVKTTTSLNVRSKPNKGGKVLCVQPTGALGTITAGPTINGGYTWWNINFDTSCDGWGVQNYLSLVVTLTTATTSSSPSSSDSSGNTAPAPTTYTSPSSDTATLSISTGSTAATQVNPSPTFTIGSRVKTTANLNIRNKPNKGGKILCVQSTGALGTITAGPTINGGYTWWNINFDTSCDGWGVQNYLSLVVVTANTPISHILSVGSKGEYYRLFRFIN